jgi:hypothetical protein
MYAKQGGSGKSNESRERILINQEKIIEFVKKHPNSTPNQVYKSINRYDWDPEFNLDIDAQRVADDFSELVKQGKIKLSRDYKVTLGT